MYELNKEVVLEIESLEHTGLGVSKKDNYIFFVDNALPSEIVRAKITRIKKNIIFADTVDIINPSENRIKVCPYQQECGGCSLINLKYEEQLKYKENKIYEIMHKFYKDKINIKGIIPNDYYYYRNKVSFHCNEKIGFYKGKTNDIIEIDSCMLTSTGINSLLKLFKEKVNYKRVIDLCIRYSDITNESMLIIRGDVNLQEIDQIKESFTTIIINDNVYSGKGYIIDKLNSLSFIISPDSFFQVNTKQAIKLYDKVSQYASLTGDERVLDLYCGTGSIGIYLSSMAKEVVGIEKCHSAIIDARRNALLNNISNISFIEGDTKYAVNSIDNNFDVIVVDPPRSGLFPNVIDYIIKVKPKKVVYVSCDPVTLARDLNILKSVFNVIELTPVDMFSNTHHVESVVLLTRK